jgi:hypothetical protein
MAVRLAYIQLSGRLPRGAGSSPARTTKFFFGVFMKAIIESEFFVRNTPYTSYYSFPEYSDQIEEILVRELVFLRKHGSDFKLSLTIEGNKK